MRWGWVGGAVFGLIGALTGRLKMINGSIDRVTERRSSEKKVDASAADAAEASPPRRDIGWILQGAGTLGLLGALLGAFVGGTLLLFWFSISFSPFAGTDWFESITTERLSANEAGRSGRDVTVTRHPIALYLFLIPFAFFLLVGILVGGIAAALGKVR